VTSVTSNDLGLLRHPYSLVTDTHRRNQTSVQEKAKWTGQACYISRGIDGWGAWTGCPQNFLLFDLKKKHFGAAFKLNLIKENCVNILSKNNKNTHYCKRKQLTPYNGYAYAETVPRWAYVSPSQELAPSSKAFPGDVAVHVGPHHV